MNIKLFSCLACACLGHYLYAHTRKKINLQLCRQLTYSVSPKSYFELGAIPSNVQLFACDDRWECVKHSRLFV